MTQFSFKKFVEKVHGAFSTDFDEPQVRDLLMPDDGYSRDKAMSTGKRLKIEKLFFKGEKYGEKFEYRRKLLDGINFWVAGNLKGKSSIFKILKFALTGNDDIEADVKSWLREIYLEFHIGDRTYTSHISLNEGFTARLYQVGLDEILDENNENKNDKLIWEVSANTKYTNSIERLFFDEFDYYSMKWTQKNPGKEKTNLSEANASWKTYFHSIFLDSKEYSKLIYGNQEGLILQMLLGLELTYPINRLTVKRDFKKNKLGLLNHSNLNNKSEKDLQKKLKTLNEELVLLNNRIEYLKTKAFDNKEYKSLEKRQNELNKKKIEIYDSKNKLRRRILSGEENILLLNESISDHLDKHKRVKRKLLSLTRNLQNLKEYTDVGIFFSNLELHACPHCDHEVSKAIIEADKGNSSCNLCHNPVEKSIIDTADFEEKIKEIELQILNFSQEKDKIVEVGKKLRSKVESYKTAKKKLAEEIEIINLSKYDSELELVSNKMHSFVNSYKMFAEERDNLFVSKGKNIQNISKIEEELRTWKSKSNKPLIIGKEIELLNHAIESLKNERANRSRNILHLFREIFKKQLHLFNLKNYSDIEISSSFTMSFTKNNVKVSFNKISAGEQLRVKLAFYLSLIELDITHNHGRHSRFLVLDTPAKEEGDKEYLDGLNETLRTIEKNFKGKMQLFVGTAERELINAVSIDKYEIKEPGKYFF